jgi:hypothetical protein
MLIDKFNKLYQERTWSYYEGIKLYKKSPFESEDVAQRFIFDYFQKGEKQSVFDSKIPINKERDLHSISIFFLGFLLKEVIDLPKLEPDFQYLWFITCLYHDYGYFIENGKKEYPPNQFCISKIKKELAISKDLLKENSNPQFISLTIKNYYRYCRKEHDFINHGIVGGLLLYDRLCKNYSRIKALAIKEKISGAKENDFYYHNLHWSISHFEFYAKVSNAIISHNIWLAEENNMDLYEKYKLKELIPSHKFSYNDDPYVFLIILVDSIEPIKFFNQISPKCILEKIDFEILKEERKIVINILDKCLNFGKWFDEIIKLQNWLEIKVQRVNITCLEINLRTNI